MQRADWAHVFNGNRLTIAEVDPRAYRFHYELDEIFSHWLPQGDNLRFLEVGCGMSIWLPYFAQKFNYQVFGFDYMERGCKVAGENLRKAGRAGTVVCADFNRPTFAREQFDVVFSMGFVEHFDPPSTAIQNVAQFAKPGGLIVTHVPNMLAWKGLLVRLVDRRMYDLHTKFDLARLRNWHEQSGCSVLTAQYHQFLDLTLYNSHRFMPVLIRLSGALNFPMLWLQQRCRLDLQHPFLCSSMIVIARKVGSVITRK
jgi:SAM-dependent methyltransferase